MALADTPGRSLSPTTKNSAKSPQIAVRIVLGLIAAFGCAGRAGAQNLSAVPTPDISPGDRTVDFRAGYSLDDDGAADVYSQRFHYQHAVGADWRFRIIVQQNKRDGDALETQSIQLQALTQFVRSEASGGWDSGVRFDGVVPIEQGRPGRARVAWLNSVDLDPRWQVRGDVFISRDIGDNAAAGLFLEIREEITCSVSNRLRLGAQFFHNMNTTARFGSFNEQRHQLGPVARVKLSERLGIDASALFGASRAASEIEFRMAAAYRL